MLSIMKISYGCGHVFNDMFLAMWFTYMLLFFVSVVHMSSTSAGIVLFAAQIGDGISNVLMGFILDTRLSCMLYEFYGRRKVIYWLCDIAIQINSYIYDSFLLTLTASNMNKINISSVVFG